MTSYYPRGEKKEPRTFSWLAVPGIYVPLLRLESHADIFVILCQSSSVWPYQKLSVNYFLLNEICAQPRSQKKSHAESQLQSYVPTGQCTVCLLALRAAYAMKSEGRDSQSNSLSTSDCTVTSYPYLKAVGVFTRQQQQATGSTGSSLQTVVDQQYSFEENKYSQSQLNTNDEMSLYVFYKNNYTNLYSQQFPANMEYPLVHLFRLFSVSHAQLSCAKQANYGHMCLMIIYAKIIIMRCGKVYARNIYLMSYFEGIHKF